MTADERLAALSTRSAPIRASRRGARTGGEIALPLRFDAGGDELSFFSTIATFGTAVDITLAELAIEAFFPADEATSAYLRRG